MAAMVSAVPLNTRCEENNLAQTEGDENLCSLSRQLAAAQKEKEDFAQSEMQKS